MSELGHHTIHKNHIHHGWNNAFTPCLTIAPGETVQFETVDASSGQLSRTSTAADIAKLDFARVNPVTGPVWIDGAEPGDALKITVLSLRPSGWGWTGNIPGFGLLTDQFPSAHLHHWNYDPGLAPAMYGSGGRVPLRPFTGTIGVAPAAPGLHSIIPPRNVGGNMDARDIGEGAELYLPIEVDGAIFSVGDTHAAQGDGEVCGTAIESPIATPTCCAACAPICASVRSSTYRTGSCRSTSRGSCSNSATGRGGRVRRAGCEHDQQRPGVRRRFLFSSTSTSTVLTCLTRNAL
jgi:acetamidase/formamidase